VSKIANTSTSTTGDNSTAAHDYYGVTVNKCFRYEGFVMCTLHKLIAFISYWYLEDAGSVRRAPSVEQVVFAGASKPFSTRGKLQRQHAAVV